MLSCVTAEKIISPSIHAGVVWSTLPGETESGDCYVVRDFPGGTLLAVLDALGRGKGAAQTARSAVRVLKDYAHEPVVSLLQRCHSCLLGTRGAVMALASLHRAQDSLLWLAVGSIEGFLLRRQGAGRFRCESLPQQYGLVGSKVPALRPLSVHLSPGDILILVTNGIQPDFVGDVEPSGAAWEIAELIVHRHARGSDEALALVACYFGTGQTTRE